MHEVRKGQFSPGLRKTNSSYHRRQSGNNVTPIRAGTAIEESQETQGVETKEITRTSVSLVHIISISPTATLKCLASACRRGRIHRQFPFNSTFKADKRCNFIIFISSCSVIGFQIRDISLPRPFTHTLFTPELCSSRLGP